MDEDRYNMLCVDMEYVCMNLENEYPNCRGCPCDVLDKDGEHICFLNKIKESIEVEDDA